MLVMLLGCCNGRECGCMGGPVAIMKCPDCNPDGKKEPLGAALEYSKYLEEV